MIDGYRGVVGAVHGVMIFGIVTVLKGLTELVEGLELVTIEMKEVELEEKQSRHLVK
ncbi:hypothetical protein [Paracoccus sp. Ld10]|uniref:hypothetical protein n=1 Tax=Paracoccus sp. Ld10 TaxID=649158 RepID=UPI00386D921C